MEEYFYNLTKIMISTCFEELAICIYKGGKIPTEFKEVILKHLSSGSKVTRSDRTKLDNSLAKYKNYLREVTKKLISNVATDVHAFFEKNQAHVMLSSDDLSVAKSDSIASLENSLKSCRECSVNIELNDSLSSLTVEQLKNMIGV
ncbi:uncharacterized protein LOC107981846 [Nasonia vitripennis]|uniref:Uncharacterized protein n=1 Tax=Nasonia vitripennis TaxID=7425 RepID=A0A7M7QK02_NASVI|nr:uncharacterized protein LOC107981846 [Nasonia vitripennis]